jgi:hypothetical protein
LGFFTITHSAYYFIIFFYREGERNDFVILVFNHQLFGYFCRNTSLPSPLHRRRGLVEILFPTWRALTAALGSTADIMAMVRQDRRSPMLIFLVLEQ